MLDAAFEGTHAGLDAQEHELLRLATRAHRTEATDTWNAREALWQDDESCAIVKFTVLPTDLPAFCADIAAMAAAQALTWRLVAQAIGVGEVRMAASDGNHLLAAFAHSRSAAEKWGGTFVVLRCPSELKSRFDPWGAPGDALPLMRRIKDQLDPGGILNPGRFVGGI